MEKFWRLLYYYFLGALVLSVTFMSVMLFSAPRQDALKRGFIPCTEQLVYNISACERGGIGCPLRYLWQDMKCNVNVVLEGFGAWVKGEQERPWSNYLFEPVAAAEIDEEIPYEGNVVRDMEDLEMRQKFVAEKLAELEKVKSRQLEFNQDVIVANPEEEKPLEKQSESSFREENVSEAVAGNIDDEAFSEDYWPEKMEIKTAPKVEKNIVHHINQKTAEHLNKEEKSNEK